LGAISIFRLAQILTAKEDLDTAYKSLKHFRNAACQRMTFDDVLADLIHAISTSIDLHDDVSNDSDNESSLTQPPSSGRGRQTRTIKVREMSWVRRTGNSPQRRVKEFYSNPCPKNESKAILRRRKFCPGNPVYRVAYDQNEKKMKLKGKGSRNHCAQCSALTNCWCTICHTWLCGPHLDRPHEEKDSVVQLNTSNDRNNSNLQKLFCLNTCWIMWHQEGLDRIHKENIAEEE